MIGPSPYPIPYGWFALGRLDQLPGEAVNRLHYFGEELVLWRDDDELHLVHARCPHLGAHLGVGGKVLDGCLVCPFHEWSYDGDGRNSSIPYANRPNGKAKLRVYPTVERNGLLLAWYHPDPDVAPLFDVPQALTDEHTEAMRMDWRINAIWQDLSENSVDMAHFKYVHGVPQISDSGEQTVNGPFRQVRSTQIFSSSRGEFEGKLESNSFGPGVGVVNFDLLGRVTVVSATTPIDDSSVDVRFTIYYSGDPAAAKIAQPFAAEIKRQFEQDIPIWESKFAVERPALAPSEKAITVFRKWASQFYVRTPD